MFNGNTGSIEETEEIYDVILFWGQSNMVGTCSDELEYRFAPDDLESIQVYSEATGIDEEILKNNGKERNIVSIEQKENTAYEYMYNTNNLEEINSEREVYGEYLHFNSVDLGGKPTNLTVYDKESPPTNKALSASRGTNMIPQFCKTYYQETGHKVIAVFAAYGGTPIRYFLPYDDEDNTMEEERYIYEALKAKYQAAIKYLTDNNYNIGNKFYVVFQGEADINRSTELYKRDFLKVHNNLKNDLGITLGAICETSTKVGEKTMEQVEKVHIAQEELIAENEDIILGSSYSYDRYVPKQSDYENCTTKIAFDINGNKLDYKEAFKRATYSVDYSKNTIHFTSAALSQVGKEVAEVLSKFSR